MIAFLIYLVFCRQTIPSKCRTVRSSVLAITLVAGRDSPEVDTANELVLNFVRRIGIVR
jgi:hypothetical protein